MERFFAFAALCLAWAAFRRYMSTRNDIRNEHWRNESVPEMKLPWKDRNVRELFVLAALVGFACGLALSQRDFLFVAFFGAACAM
jgi:hypothetical protein